MSSLTETMTTVGVPGGRTIRWLLAALTLLSTAVALFIYHGVAAVGGVNLFESLSYPLFAILFGWVAFSFWTATLGFLLTLRPRAPHGKEPHSPPPPESALPPTAILMPIYNESPTSVLAGVQAMMQSLQATGQAEHFDFFILSDTTDPDVWLEEERAWARLVAEQGTHPRVFYRRRPRNFSRKAGNIADFCTRWGSQYEFMIVLDADSIMEGRTLVEMARRMQADPKLGILQVPPTPVNRQSFFARLQQFSSRMYGPIFIRGFTGWAQNDGNYWGHNAIIRVEPFARHCGLPLLPGKAPLGGEILSHDFVEAALMARAGWKVALADDLGGSYEECPTTLLDYAKRDQRWCQGNMQHIRLIISEGFRPISRLHLSMGVMSYLSSPLWLLFMLISVAGLMFDDASEKGEAGRALGAASLFAVTMSFLLLPKLWAVIAMAWQPERLKEFGGWDNVIGSVVLETLVSILLAPLMMLFHTRFVVTTMLGQKVHWTAQNRGEAELDLGQALLVYGPHMLLGVGLLIVVGLLSPMLLIWFLPIITGLILAVPLAMILGSVPVGKRLARQGLLLIPEEIFTPRVLRLQQQALQEHEKAALEMDRARLFDSVLTDPAFHALHRNILQATDAQLSAPKAELTEIISIIERDGPDAVPKHARRVLLSDAQALRNLHVKLRSQMPLTRSALMS